MSRDRVLGHSARGLGPGVCGIWTDDNLGSLWAPLLVLAADAHLRRSCALNSAVCVLGLCRGFSMRVNLWWNALCFSASFPCGE